jgi:hypothetical protein
MTPIIHIAPDWYVITGEAPPEKPHDRCSHCAHLKNMIRPCDCDLRWQKQLLSLPRIKISNPDNIRMNAKGEFRWVKSNVAICGRLQQCKEGEIYYWPGGYELVSIPESSIQPNYFEAVLTQEPEQKDFDPFLVCGPPERKKRKKSLEKQGTEIIEQWGKSKVDNSVMGHTEENSAHSFTEGSDSNLYVCPHTKQACFHSNCTYGYCGNPPAPVDNQEESQDELWETVLLVIKLCEEKGCNKVISLKGIFDLTRKK